MRTSEKRVLTTHVGSLPRPKKLADLLIARDHGKKVSEKSMRREVEAATDWVVKKQIESGIDIGNDGEEARVGFQTYVTNRMSGFSGVSKRKLLTDMTIFPKYAEMFTARIWSTDAMRPRVWNAPQARTAVKYESDMKDVKFEMGIFADSLKRSRKKFAETFVTAASPGIVSTTMLRYEKNPAYKTDADYVLALAKELKGEYEYIVKQGHILQIDAPDLAMERQFMFQGRPLKEFLKRVELHIKAMNIALANIPPAKSRLHVCWGNWDGPHIDDVELEPLLPLLYEAKVGALSLACANPRHQHDWHALKNNPLPKSMILIPGLIDVTTNYLEHPIAIADRICKFVEVMGDRERVIAGADCGFSTFANYVMVAEDVVWAKLKMLSEGAEIATKRLYG
ncbi:MAG: methionine synthase [Alphaproteobacteria bacterium]|nr:methionine synthase [Alphaproteobacteria bacterium]